MKLNEIPEYFRPDLYEMSNFWDNDTGLPTGTKLWIREQPKGLPHTKYRIKIGHPQKGSAVFSLWGDEPQQVAGDWEVSGDDLKKVTRLIQLTADVLRKHINGEVSSTDVSNGIQNSQGRS